MDYNEIMKMRFNATPCPQPTGDIGNDKERIVQWFFEITFFKDFVYRNPEGKKKGKEHSDALIIWDDSIIIVQVKAHDSSKPVEKWIKKELPNAYDQLKGAHRIIKEGIVKNFENETLNTQVSIDPSKHKYIYGVIILSCDSPKLDPMNFLELEDPPRFALNIFSLNDLETVCKRMDTAGDFLAYYDMRFNARKQILPKLQDEKNTMQKMIPLLPSLLGDGENFKKLTTEKQQKNLEFFARKLESDTTELPQYEYSMLIDDIIARAHDVDESLYAVDEKGKIEIQRIAEFFGYVSRKKRIALGKKMYECAKDAMDGSNHWFLHCQKAAERTFVYLYTSDSREGRRKFLMALIIAAQKKYKFPRVLGIATNPLGKGGRSYDFVLIEKHLPEDVLKEFDGIDELLNKPDHPLL